MAVGLRTAAGGSIGGIEETSLRALAKLEQVLPTRLRRRVNALQTFTVLVPRDEREPTVDPTVLTVLAAACRDHDRLRFGYRDRGGGPSQREVEPYRLVNWGRRWYLVAWDLERADWRTFRVDRLHPRLPVGAKFTPRQLPSEDIAAYVASGVAQSTWPYRARVRVDAPAVAIAERIGRWVGTVDPIDDATCTIDVGANTPETMALYLGMLDADFAVIDPPELRDHLRRPADRYRPSASARPPGRRRTTAQRPD